MGKTEREYIFYVNNFAIFVERAIFEPKICGMPQIFGVLCILTERNISND